MTAFDDFWSVYPRRVAKLAARRKFDQALRHATAEQIIAGAQAYARVTQNTEMQFIKHPATWLSGGCWDDDMSAVAPRTMATTTMANLFSDMEAYFGSEGQGRSEPTAQGTVLGLPGSQRRH